MVEMTALLVNAKGLEGNFGLQGGGKSLENSHTQFTNHQARVGKFVESDSTLTNETQLELSIQIAKI